jgi:hypothetical protein
MLPSSRRPLGAKQSTGRGSEVVDISRDLLAAIGLVVVEATNLEWTLAGLIATRRGWDGEQEVAVIAKNGAVRVQLSELAKADPEWAGVHALKDRADSLLAQRNDLVHSVVVYVRDEDDVLHDIEMWHARSGRSRALPTVSDLTTLAAELNSCAVGAVMSLSEAEDRFANLGDPSAP